MFGRKQIASREFASRSLRRLGALHLESLETRTLLAADPVISEFVARNDGGLRDGDGRTPDWIEIQNVGDEAVDLSGYRLTDDADELTKWKFPSISLEAGEFLIVFASGQDSGNYVDAGGFLHTNFSLSRSGDYIALVDPSGTVLSEFGNEGMPYPEQLANVSYGLGTSTVEPARAGYFTTPTPGTQNAPNDEVFASFVGDTKFSVDRGYYDEPVEVEISTATAGAVIHYTTDGSEPTLSNGSQYAGPLTVSTTTVLRAAAFADNAIPSNVDTQTYIFLNDVVQQDGAGLPETWGVFPFGTTEAAAGDPVPSNYEVDPKVVNDPRYRDTIEDDLRTLPTISVVMDPNDLWDPERGIYANPVEQGVDWERAASVEMIGTDGKSTEFQIDSGVRIHGGFGRRPSACAKHSLRLLFKGEYGPTKLEYPLFGEDQVDQFDTIVLRANYNYSWCRGNRGGAQTGADYTMVTDAWGAVAQEDMGGLSPNSTFVHLYLNGLYWGVYVPTERPNASFQAEHRGGDKEDYDVMGHSGLIDGSSDAWRDVGRLARRNPVDFAALEETIDMDNYIDYMILNQFGGNGDWPQNNWFASRKREDGEKWQFHSWDTEFFFINLNENRIRTIPSQGPGIFYNELRNDDAFRLHFADRIHRHLFNNGALTPDANVARLNTLAEPLDRAVVGESARWGDAWMDQVDPPRTRDDDWIPRLDELREDYFPRRTEIVIRQYRSVGLYPSADAPVFSQHGGDVVDGFGLSIDGLDQEGTIYVTTDGSDPRAADGTASPTAFAFEGVPLTIRESQTVKARFFDGDEWSALTEADFTIPVVRQPGDSNGDGIFNSSDLVFVFRAAEYEDGIDGNSTFEEGDWNGDGDFDSADLVAAFQAANYVAEASPRAPDPAAIIDLIFGDDSPLRKKTAFIA